MKDKRKRKKKKKKLVKNKKWKKNRIGSKTKGLEKKEMLNTMNKFMKKSLKKIPTLPKS